MYLHFMNILGECKLMCIGKLVIIAVYGTLKKDGPLCIRREILCSSEDKVKGQLYNVPEANFPFPGIDLKGDKWVDVEVQVVSEDYLAWISVAEGDMYTKKKVVTKGGVPVLLFECNVPYDKEDTIDKWNNNRGDK